MALIYGATTINGYSNTISVSTYIEAWLLASGYTYLEIARRPDVRTALAQVEAGQYQRPRTYHHLPHIQPNPNANPILVPISLEEGPVWPTHSSFLSDDEVNRRQQNRQRARARIADVRPAETGDQARDTEARPSQTGGPPPPPYSEEAALEVTSNNARATGPSVEPNVAAHVSSDNHHSASPASATSGNIYRIVQTSSSTIMIYPAPGTSFPPEAGQVDGFLHLPFTKDAMEYLRLHHHDIYTSIPRLRGIGEIFEVYVDTPPAVDGMVEDITDSLVERLENLGFLVHLEGKFFSRLVLRHWMYEAVLRDHNLSV